MSYPVPCRLQVFKAEGGEKKREENWWVERNRVAKKYVKDEKPTKYQEPDDLERKRPDDDNAGFRWVGGTSKIIFEDLRPGADQVY